ncbi:MAG: hypothetical protein ABSF00_09465 [Candidatus Bathyarchaeia archaeon]|jgi:hypothetical protein
MRSPEANLVLQILQSQVACQLEELNNRIQALTCPPTVVDPAIRQLQAEKKVSVRLITTPSEEKTETRFIYCTDFSQTQIDEVIQEKAQLLAKHYDLHEEIGLHGENLVTQICQALGYTEVETRKKSHLTQDLLEPGIARRDIDVFAKHPTNGYYQNIQVKNRRAKLETKEVDEFIRTTSIARLRWKLDIRTAVVAVRTQPKAASILIAEHIPIAYAGNIYAPEKYHDLYEELNQRLSYGFVITDNPSNSEPLYKNISQFILGHNYTKPI